MTRDRRLRDRVTGSILLFFVLGLAACASGSRLGPIEVSTTPPDLRYVPPERVRETMWVLAAETETLERLLATEPLSDERARSQAIGGSLRRMQRAVSAVDQPGRTSQHPLLNQHLTSFAARLERARRAVERDPPNYYLAGTVSGACFACHGATD